jgi:hypothetical protein
VAAITSPATSVVAGGVLTVIGAAVLALAMPEFRTLEVRPEDVVDAAMPADAADVKAGAADVPAANE